jgi:hypothetical protein
MTEDCIPMTKLTRDELLILLIEECGEVIQAATKCLRFGYDTDHGVGYGQNDHILSNECGDLQGVIDALPLERSLLELCRANKIAKAEVAKTRYGAAGSS